jgi:membrane protein YdbS with pleckstrin-like domain
MEFRKRIKQLNIGSKQIMIRKSVVPFINNFINNNILIILLFAVLIGIFTFIPLSFKIINSTIIASIAVISLVCLEIYMIVSSYLSWNSELYMVTHDSITEIFGFMFKTQKTYLIRNIMEIKLSQGLLDKIFHFGTVVIITQLKKIK